MPFQKKIEYKIGENINGITYLGNESIVTHSGQNYRKADFLCECGNIFHTFISFVRTGHAKSCGCLKIKATKKSNTKHGQSNVTPEYRSWCGAKDRCYNENSTFYENYGGRGITVCDRWLGENGFSNFFEDMGKRPSKNHSLDRFPNNDDGIYEKSNCRWATHAQQNKNKRNNVWIEYNGEKKICKDWAIELNVGHSNLKRMLIRKTFEECYLFYKNKVA